MCKESTLTTNKTRQLSMKQTREIKTEKNRRKKKHRASCEGKKPLTSAQGRFMKATPGSKSCRIDEFIGMESTVCKCWLTQMEFISSSFGSKRFTN